MNSEPMSPQETALRQFMGDTAYENMRLGVDAQRAHLAAHTDRELAAAERERVVARAVYEATVAARIVFVVAVGTALLLEVLWLLGAVTF